MIAATDRVTIKGLRAIPSVDSQSKYVAFCGCDALITAVKEV